MKTTIQVSRGHHQGNFEWPWTPPKTLLSLRKIGKISHKMNKTT